jgi:hypothetical protein
MGFVQNGFSIAFGFGLGAVFSAAAAAGDLKDDVSGSWSGNYCGDGSATAWVISMKPSGTFARERWCNGFVCGDVDYRISQYSGAERKFEVIPKHSPGWSLSNYSIVFQQSGNVLSGVFYNHPRCHRIDLQKVSNDVSAGPLIASTPEPLPPSGAFVEPEIRSAPVPTFDTTPQPTNRGECDQNCQHQKWHDKWYPPGQ